MTLIPVEEVIARVPMWQNAVDIQVLALEGGITNRNYRVDVRGESYHLRLPGENTELLGIDREHEHSAQQIASQAGIAPDVIYLVRPERFLITRFIHGRPIPPDELRQPENLQQVAETLKKIHALPDIPGVFSAFQVVRDYEAVARSYDVPFPENYEWLMSQMKDAESALMAQALVPRPCHNDLLNGNFLLAEKLYILDWEYAGMGDIFFDLANFSVNHELYEEEIHLLLECYFGKVTARTLAHFHIMRIMSDFREAMWGQVQIGISDLDFDFQAYANKHFDRLTLNITDPSWDRWLREVR